MFDVFWVGNGYGCHLVFVFVLLLDWLYSCFV